MRTGTPAFVPLYMCALCMGAFVGQLMNATFFAMNGYAQLRAQGLPAPNFVLLLGLDNGAPTHQSFPRRVGPPLHPLVRPPALIMSCARFVRGCCSRSGVGCIRESASSADCSRAAWFD